MKIEELRSRITPLTKKNNIIKVTRIIQMTTLKSILIKTMKKIVQFTIDRYQTTKKNIFYFMMGR